MQFMQALSDFHKKNLEEYSFRKNQSYDRKHMHMQIADPTVGGPEQYDLLFSKILNESDWTNSFPSLIIKLMMRTRMQRMQAHCWRSMTMR